MQCQAKHTGQCQDKSQGQLKPRQGKVIGKVGQEGERLAKMGESYTYHVNPAFYLVNFAQTAQNSPIWPCNSL